MRGTQSAGVLVYRKNDGALEVFLVHPGGPLWRNKDAGAWGIPKGIFDPAEAPLDAARREFAEETGAAIDGTFLALTPRRLKSGKVLHAFAVEGSVDAAVIRSNTFSMEWPPRSGRYRSFPEVDRGAWFGLDEARARINEGQRPLLAELEAVLQSRSA
jgi:predicted NUDIX family NTP pyrophosphohydrolase